MKTPAAAQTLETGRTSQTTTQSSILAGTFCLLVAGVGYLLSNHLHVSAATQLPLSWLDHAIPFWPASGWFYALQYPLLIWAFFSFDNADRRTRFLYACMLMQTIAVAIFVIYPIAYPRELFPMPAETHWINQALVNFWRTLDTPANCLPSLHVSSAALSVSAFKSGKARRFFGVSVLLASLTAASTLTFKQHYFVDILAGLALAGFCYWLMFRRQPLSIPRNQMPS